MKHLCNVFLIGLTLVIAPRVIATGPVLASPRYFSPIALVGSTDGKSLFIACATGNCILRFDTGNKNIVSLAMPDIPSGLALSPDGKTLFVTCAASESKVCIVDVSTLKIIENVIAGHTATAPIASPDGKTLYVCNQFNNDVSVIDLAEKKEVRRIAVQREPVAADITKDGKYLLVANQLPAGRADAPYVAAVVSVIDVVAGKVIKELQLPHGSGSLKDIRISPDGKNAAVTHILARFYHPTTDVFRGWINANALTIIDVPSLTIHGTILLDEPDKGAANPWGLAWSADNSKLLVAHAGTHEVSVINFRAMAAELPPPSIPYQNLNASNLLLKTTREQAEFSNYSIPFLVGGRQRIPLGEGNLGPRCITVIGQKAYAANYFSDSLSIIDLATAQLQTTSIPLGPKLDMDVIRKGEFNFHNASICYQNWQSCSSCHPGNGRMDGFNWDYLNIEAGNPRNTRSLLLAHKTPPIITRGVPSSAEFAVRAGIKFILFTNQPEEFAVSIDEYLKSLKPVPSPYLHRGELSAAARHGQMLFISAGCADCHVPGLFTDLKVHNVGTQNRQEKEFRKFYTPTLTEVWRTAPYLHDGSAATIKDVLNGRNDAGLHGDVKGLSDQEIDDLCDYVLSL